jgi:type IV pilus assembly protein PilO
MAITDQFKYANWRDPGTLPALPKLAMLAGAALAVVVAGYAFDWRDQLGDLDAGRATEEKLKQEYKQKKGQAINLDAYERQYKEVETTFGTLLKQLPNKQQVEALLVEINQAGLQRGLQFELFKPAQETFKEFYAELPISLKVTGGYHDMGGFASDVAQLSRIVTLTDVAVSTTKEGVLVMDTTAKTFRYLDDDEIQSQKKARAAQMQKGKK